MLAALRIELLQTLRELLEYIMSSVCSLKKTKARVASAAQVELSLYRYDCPYCITKSFIYNSSTTKWIVL